jgi:hypothetical protein
MASRDVFSMPIRIPPGTVVRDLSNGGWVQATEEVQAMGWHRPETESYTFQQGTTLYSVSEHLVEVRRGG